jgi:putative flippase GtrA
MKIPILYVGFAVLATIVNLLTQELTSHMFVNSYELAASMFMGTLAGLVVKYILDKKYIFNFTAETQKKDLSTFFFYSLMGIVTTLLFWVTEYAFDAWFETKTMRYIGATIGLSIGYITKYHLDKKFVFVER